MKSHISLFLAALSLPVSAATLYQEKFETSIAGDSIITSPNSPLSLVAWNGYTGTSSGIVDDNPANSSLNRTGVLRGGSGPNGSDSANSGYLFAQNAVNAVAQTDYFFYTSTSVTDSRFTAFSPASYTDLTANWSRNVTSFGSGGYHFAVEVAGQWYATTVNHLGTTGALNLLTTTWRTIGLTTTGAGSLTLSPTSSSFSYNDLFGAGQSITGIGYYIDDMPVPPTTGTITLRIDDITIEGIPEPSSTMMGLLGASFVFLRRRK